jgi:3-oxoacyl-[acyl-carrier protein] reductase
VEEKLRFLVLGASGGIGLEVTRQLLMDGHTVVASFHNNRMTELDTFSSVSWINLNLADHKYLRSELQKLGEFDGLIHCAGIVYAEKIENIQDSTMEEMFMVNLQSAIIAASVLLPGMINRNFGRMVFIGSIVGTHGGIGLSVYSSTKSGLEGFVRSVHKEIIITKTKKPDLNLTVNLVRPGYVETKMTKNLNPKIREGIISNSTLGRFLTATELSRFINLLLRPESNYISGRFHNLDGGQEI